MYLFSQHWRNLMLFNSASTTQKYLQECYQHLPIEYSQKYSFQNCSSFMYYLEYATTYYKQAESCDFTIRPILQFYGYINLLKACLLTIDPRYPNSTSLLAHGVTTRKRKKQQYHFLEDEVKIQKDGLFTYIGEKMFHMKHLAGEKLSMKNLICSISELLTERRYFHLDGSFELTKITNLQYVSTNKILDSFHLSAKSFETFLKKTYNISLHVKEEKNHLYFYLETPFTFNYHKPFMYNLLNNKFYFPYNKSNNDFKMNELMIHYLLLYNLSMIARYETEWWMDLIKTTPNEDFPLIQAFLDITQLKGPFLISKWLLEERKFITN